MEVRVEQTRRMRAARHRAEVRGFYRGTALSTLFPGAGLFRVNRVLAGAIVALFVAAVVALLILFLRHGALGSLLEVAVDAGRLRQVMVATGVLALAWVIGIVATAIGRRPTRLRAGDRVAMTLFTLAMCALVIAPTALALQGVQIQRTTVVEVVTDTDRPAQTVDGPDPWAEQPRVNLLLLGSDHADDREGVRPDSIMVASVDTASGDTVLIGLPRNLQRVPFPVTSPMHQVFPDGFSCGSECLLNAVWTAAEDRPDLFPGDQSPGLTATRDVVSEVTGLSIDDTVLVNLQGFEQLVDAMGGVTINALERVPTGGRVVGGQVVDITGWIEPGVQHMDGYTALWYARSRATTDDFSRMRRQRCVVGAIIDQVDPLRMLARYPQLAAAVADNVSVDIPADDLGAWAELVLRIKDGRLQSLPITNEVVNVADPDFELIRELVDEAITAPPPPAPVQTPVPTSTEHLAPGSTSGPTPTPTPTDGLADLGTTC